MGKNVLHKNGGAHAGFLFILPAISIIAIVMFFPLIYNILLSFNSKTLYNMNWTFVGLEQYGKLFANPTFHKVMGNTIVWTIFSVFFQFTLGFTSAMIISQDFIKGKTILRILIMVSWVLPSIIGVNIWKWMYHPDFGILNHMLVWTGILKEPLNWTSSSNTALLSAIIVNVWKMFPLVMLYIEASLQSLPKELKDAAKVDGATPFGIFRVVTLPHISGTCFTVLLQLTIWTMNAFTFIFVLTEGGPGNESEVLSLFIYKQAFRSYDFAMASTASTVLFLIVAICSALYIKFVMGRVNQ